MVCENTSNPKDGSPGETEVQKDVRNVYKSQQSNICKFTPSLNALIARYREGPPSVRPGAFHCMLWSGEILPITP